MEWKDAWKQSKACQESSEKAPPPASQAPSIDGSAVAVAMGVEAVAVVVLGVVVVVMVVVVVVVGEEVAVVVEAAAQVKSRLLWRSVRNSSHITSHIRRSRRANQFVLQFSEWSACFFLSSQRLFLILLVP